MAVERALRGAAPHDLLTTARTTPSSATGAGAGHPARTTHHQEDLMTSPPLVPPCVAPDATTHHGLTVTGLWRTDDEPTAVLVFGHHPTTTPVQNAAQAHATEYALYDPEDGERLGTPKQQWAVFTPVPPTDAGPEPTWTMHDATTTTTEAVPVTILPITYTPAPAEQLHSEGPADTRPASTPLTGLT